MLRNRIKQILASARDGQQVTIRGWVKSKRSSKTFSFVMLNDGSMLNDLQILIDHAAPAAALLEQCTTGACLEANGVIKASPGKGQEWEVHCDAMKILGACDPEKYPLQKKGHTLEFLREIGHLRSRSNTFGAVFRVRNQLASLVHEFFQSHGFIWAHTPIITASDCEGAGEMFTVTTLDLGKLPRTPSGAIDHTQDFFGKHAHLTVSGQLNGECMALGLGDIYTFGPTFRAENSNTTRHLSEFWMIEPEMAFADLREDMVVAEEFLRFVFGNIVQRCQADLEFMIKHYQGTTIDELVRMSQEPFGRISYTDAVAELKRATVKFEFPVEWGIDLQSEHERYLTDQVFKRPLIVTDYPKDIKAFYMRQNADGRTVAAMDILAPRIGEIVGGSQREDRIDVLEQRIQEMKLPAKDLWWYLDLRRFGSAPHSGFGLGFERLVQYVTGMSNIRDVIPFPRAPQTIEF